MRTVSLTFLLGFIALIVISCDNKNSEVEPIYIKTSYAEVDSVFSSKVAFGGEITELPDNATDYGFVFGLSEAPEIETDSVVTIGKPDFEGDFFEYKSGLKPGIQYYVRAYLTVNGKTYYGEDIGFSMALITDIQPAGAGRLDTVVIHGVNFSSNINKNTIKFNDVSIEVLSVSQEFLGEQMKVVLPNDINLGEKTVSIEINDTKSEYGRIFTVDPYIPIPDFPGVERTDPVSFTINGFFYVGTGKKEDGTYLNDFYRYDPENREWAQINNFPGNERCNAISFTVNDKAYVGLGQNQTVFFKDFYEYNPISKSWTAISEFPGEGRIGSAGFSVEDTGYVALGRTYNDYFRDVYKYMVGSNTWLKLNDFPVSTFNVFNVSTFEMNGYVYLIADTEPATTSWVYQYNQDKWVEADLSLGGSTINLFFTLEDRAYNFMSLSFYDEYMHFYWESYIFRHRKNDYSNIAISDNKTAIVGGADYSNEYWIFNPD